MKKRLCCMQSHWII